MHNSDRLAISLMFGIYVADKDGGSLLGRLATLALYSFGAYVIWLKLDGIRS